MRTIITRPTPLLVELIHWLPICRRLMAKTLYEDKWWIISPHVGQTSRIVPVNPVPSFIALWQVCKPDSIYPASVPGSL